MEKKLRRSSTPRHEEWLDLGPGVTSETESDRTGDRDGRRKGPSKGTNVSPPFQDTPFRHPFVLLSQVCPFLRSLSRISSLPLEPTSGKKSLSQHRWQHLPFTFTPLLKKIFFWFTPLVKETKRCWNPLSVSGKVWKPHSNHKKKRRFYQDPLSSRPTDWCRPNINLLGLGNLEQGSITSDPDKWGLSTLESIKREKPKIPPDPDPSSTPTPEGRMKEGCFSGASTYCHRREGRGGTIDVF